MVSVLPESVKLNAVLALLILGVTSVISPAKGRAKIRLLALASSLTVAVAVVPPFTVFRIGSAPVAFSTELEPPKFTGVQSLLLPD